MKKHVLTLALMASGLVASAQIQFDPSIPVSNWEPTTVLVPQSPLKTQVIFIGGHHYVQTGVNDSTLAKQWHDFIGFTPDPNSNDLGWVSVNHEMIEANPKIGDGGGMTVFKVRRDATTDSIIIVPQTLNDGRTGKFFNVDFSPTGETGMNCGGISTSDGRIWTAEEWYQGSNSDIYAGGNGFTDTTDFTISGSGIAMADGQTVKKYQNLNWMVEIDPIEAKSIRKQYNWGKQGFEAGVVMPDNKTVYLGVDATPGFFTKFVATTAGDFTSGKTYVYKHDAPGKWVEVDNTSLTKMLNFDNEAINLGATMFNRIEWVAMDPASGKVYFTETGRDFPASAWRGESAAGAVHSPHHLARAAAQSTHPDSSNYWDYYGRVMEFNPTNDDMNVFLEGGPYLPVADPQSYPSVHLSNPDGLTFMEVNGRSYMVVQEDLNGSSVGRVPAGVSNRTCEAYILDMTIQNPTLNDLRRIAVVPKGAEVTGARATPDGKTLFINAQHPSTSNPFPYNNSLTIAITGWDKGVVGLYEEPNFSGNGFEIFPNPASRMLYFNETTDVAIYDVNGKRMKVYREVDQVDISDLSAGVYFVKNAKGDVQRLIVQ
ncbi:MAG: DUF839 domain-containing protein [Bacteroidota bacterium]|nr:DUF839 domain-containing protein [Bacteroidota bacterium]